jgi:phenylalanyl-tRNA synthetase beta chain
VAIGTHDLDTLQGPFTYDAIQGDLIRFVPLTHTASSRVFTATELLTHYETDPACKHLKPFVPIIKDSPVYPVVLDANGTVMSLPPIINGSHSRIQLSTTNVFIECTATDLTKANIVLDTVVAMFSEYAARPFTVEPVHVQYMDGSDTHVIRTHVTPVMYTRQERASVDFVNSLIGIQLTADQMVQLCNKVQLGPASIVATDGDQHWLQVTVPPTRSDILHPVDIAEDIGIAFGYNNIVRRTPTTSSVGAETSLNKLSDLLREEISRAGYIEVLTHGLCSIHDNFLALQRPPRLHSAVSLSNPANVEYQVVRTTLLPGLLKTLEHNKAMSFAHGFKVFEISDVVLVDTSHVITNTIVGAKNARRICAVYASTTSGFEIIHGLVDRIMTLTEVAPEKAYLESSLKKGVAVGGADSEERCRISRDGWFYTIRELQVTLPDAASTAGNTTERILSAATDASYSYFPGRAAQILLSRPGVESGAWVPIGTFGILHPHVLNNFNIQYPSSCLEMDLEPLL